MMHSSSAQVWQNRWDGGPGFKDMFLRRDYPVYLWDGPRVGRANWACEPTSYTPNIGRDQSHFTSWNFGPRVGQWWDDVQFPVDDEFAWDQAVRARYVEYDTAASVRLHAEALAAAVDTGRISDSVVLLTNSAAGLRAQLAATLSKSGNIRAIVAYESVGYVFPEGASVPGRGGGRSGDGPPRGGGGNRGGAGGGRGGGVAGSGARPTATTGGSGTGRGRGAAGRPSPTGTPGGGGGFGPFFVPESDFKRLASLAAVQFVWGDHRSANYSYIQQARRAAELINGYGGNARVVLLGDDEGLKGSTHIPFADMDNDKVADLLEEMLVEEGLDGYA